jgi:hypothetical protein
MTKPQRRELITQLVNDGEDQTDIIRAVIAKSGAKQATIEKDIEDLYPDGLPTNTPTPSKAVEKIVYVEVVPEVEKGRIKPEDYEVKPGEETYVHAEIEAVNFEPSTGKKKSVPFVQIFEKRAWKIFSERARQLGYTHVKLLHLPEGVKA